MDHDAWNPDELRTRFITRLSDMYKAEVPLYSTLVEIVRQVDESVLTGQGKQPGHLPVRHELERHGAIRLGTPHELHTIGRMFALFGMHPVGYYDLSVVGFPLHATAFRPLSENSLRQNPFRVFTTLLRRDMLTAETQDLSDNVLRKRSLFTPRLLDIVGRAESAESPLTSEDADNLIVDALKIFQWHSRSSVSLEEYNTLQRTHPMIADIACFPSAHINHLTPRTLDIDLVQSEMISQGMPAKDKIEGPPKRQCPILLRQTSFKALEEQVDFTNADGAFVHATHTARFGEVEQRGAAVTRKGRALYDRLLSLAQSKCHDRQTNSKDQCFDRVLAEAFSEYPDTWAELRTQGLVHFRYHVSDAGRPHASKIGGSDTSKRHSMTLDELVTFGLVGYEPITYEDFLPFSAAGIFESNVGGEPAGSSLRSTKTGQEGLTELEAAVGRKTLDPFDLYAELEEQSIQQCSVALNLDEIVVS